MHPSHTMSQEEYSLRSGFLVHLSKMMYRGAFFFVSKFSFFGLLGGRGEVKGKSVAQSKNNNYIRHTPCLRNSIAYDQGFWYNCVKLWYLQAFFPFFPFSFFGLLGRKRAKNGPRWKKFMSVTVHISGTIHHMILIYGTHL